MLTKISSRDWNRKFPEYYFVATTVLRGALIVSKSKNKLTAWSVENSEWPRRHWFKNWAWLVEEVALVFLTCHKGQENKSDQFAISLKLNLIGWGSGASFLNQLPSTAKQDRSNLLLPKTPLKIALVSTFNPASALPRLKYPFGQSGASDMATSASWRAFSYCPMRS